MAKILIVDDRPPNREFLVALLGYRGHRLLKANDGAEGLGAVKKAGGLTIAQSEDSCVVFGMPKAAIERGYATRVVGLDVLPATLQAFCGREDKQAAGGNTGKAVRAGI